MVNEKCAYTAATKQLENANDELAAMLREETDKALANVLKETSRLMKNAFARADR